MDENLKNRNPVITVLMPVYNGEKYIGSAIESILSQTFTDFELLILDDASTDQSVKIIQSFKNERIRLIENKKHLGLAKIRQKGVLKSKGKYIAFLDCDDISLPQRLSVQIQFLEKNRDISMVGSWVKVINEKGEFTGNIWRHTTSSIFIPSVLLFRNCFTQSSILIKKDCLLHFPFRNQYWLAPDYDLWTRLVTQYNLANIPEVLIYYRTFKENMSSEKKKEIEECGKRIFFNNLKRLGFIPTNEEVMLHDSLERWQGDYSKETADKIQLWLLKLIDSNEKMHIYPHKVFLTIVRDYWFKACCKSANHGFSIWQKYLRSPINRLVRSNWKLNIYLLALCLLEKNRVIDITSDSWIKLIHRIGISKF